MSFSDPKFVFKLYLHTPSGPDYMIVDHFSQIKYKNKEKEDFEWEAKHHYKRVSGKCDDSNIIFSTHGQEIEKMFVLIKLYLSTSSYPMALIHYTFEDGFKDDNYTMIDRYENFGISAEVMYSENQLFPSAIDDLNKAENFLISIPHYNHICIVTEIFHQIIIKHYYDSYKPKGYVIGVMVELEYHGGGKEQYKFNAFECHIDETFFYSPAFFITEGEAWLTFKAIYVKFDDPNKRIFKDADISVPNINRESFHARILNQNTKNVYLMKKHKKSIPCEDGTRRIVYRSKNEIVYHATYELDVEVDHKVKQDKFLIYPLDNPCGE